VAVVVVPLALLAGLAVWAQTTKHYDGDCDSDDLHSDKCYGGFVGIDAGYPVGANEVFTTALTTIDVTVAANGYVCPGLTHFYLKQGGSVMDTWNFTTTGSTVEYEHTFDVALGGQYWFEMYGEGSVCGWIEWVDVYGVEGTTPEPTPTPETGCINDNPELETSTGWTDIGAPEWMTETVVLDQGDGFLQTVNLPPGAYTVHITATIDPENLDYKPLTVSLGITETAQRVDMWAVEYVNFAISEAGTYTLSVQSDYDGQVELGWTCLMAVPCVNEDQYLMNDQRWDAILEPEFLSYSGGAGVRLEYMEGVRQQVTLSAGGYRLEVSATMPITFPYDRTDLQMCLGAACADSHVLTDTNTVAIFNVLTGGDYDLTLTNLSTSWTYTGTNVMTVTYACLSPIENLCLVTDPGMDNIHVPMLQSGEQGWLTTYDDLLAYPGGAMLGCDQTVEQWVYLESGTYTMTLHAASDFQSVALSTITPVSATLTIWVGSENESYDEYDTYLVSTQYVNGENLGDPDYNQVYTVTITIPEAGNYLLSFGNHDCVEGIVYVKTGWIWVDYVCLGDETPGSLYRGQCQTLIDASFQEYNAPHWEQSGAVTWEPGMIRLAAGASIAQSVDISETELVAYVVARAEPGAELAADLGGITATWQISQSLPNQFSIFTATLSGLTLPATYTLESNSGSIEIDFTCLYHPGDVPDGPWDDDDDNDNACTEPLPLASGWSWDIIANILRLIWDWIVYGVCIIVHWLQKIWLALGNWIKEIAIDLGLDQFWAAFVAWIVQLWQMPYDAAMLTAYVINLLLGLGGRLFNILLSGALLAFMFFTSVLTALRFIGSLLGSFWAAIANPCSALSLPVPSAVVQGYLIVVQVLAQIDTLGVIQGMLIGAMGIGVLLWTVSQFKSLGGGGE
jgi:hypothetical protein